MGGHHPKVTWNRKELLSELTIWGEKDGKAPCHLPERSLKSSLNWTLVSRIHTVRLEYFNVFLWNFYPPWNCFVHWEIFIFFGNGKLKTFFSSPAQMWEEPWGGVGFAFGVQQIFSPGQFIFSRRERAVAKFDYHNLKREKNALSVIFYH